MARTSKRTGRRPGTPSTKEQIVDAARTTFARDGFRGTTIRSIAQAAAVDPALIHHYFGTKENLFAATLTFPEGAAGQVLAALSGDPAGIGERLARAYLTLWENPATHEQMVILSRSSLLSETAMAQVRHVIEGVIGQVDATRALPGRDPEVRFSMAMGQLLGIACVRHLTKAPPLRDLSFEDLIARTAPVIELQLTQP